MNRHLSNRMKVEECLEIEHYFNDWEIEFLQGLNEKPSLDRLTELQQNKLNQIYDRACKSPY